MKSPDAMTTPTQAIEAENTPKLRCERSPTPLSGKMIAQMQAAVDAAQRKRMAREKLAAGSDPVARDGSHRGAAGDACAPGRGQHVKDRR
jgi:hypothetical protein